MMVLPVVPENKCEQMVHGGLPCGFLSKANKRHAPCLVKSKKDTPPPPPPMSSYTDLAGIRMPGFGPQVSHYNLFFLFFVPSFFFLNVGEVS